MQMPSPFSFSCLFSAPFALPVPGSSPAILPKSANIREGWNEDQIFSPIQGMTQMYLMLRVHLKIILSGKAIIVKKRKATIP